MAPMLLATGFWKGTANSTWFVSSSLGLHPLADMSEMPKAGYPSVNETDIASLLIPLSSQAEQQALLEKIATHEAKRRETEAIFAAASGQKRQILLDSIK